MWNLRQIPGNEDNSGNKGRRKIAVVLNNQRKKNLKKTKENKGNKDKRVKKMKIVHALTREAGSRESESPESWWMDKGSHWRRQSW